MAGIWLRVIIVLVCVEWSASAEATDDYLSVKFSKKNQVRTAMTWIRFKPKIVLAAQLGRSSRTMHRESGRVKDAGRSAQPVLAEDLKNGKPFSTVGKLLYTKSDGQVASCTASFAGKTDVIMTAAHCLMSRSGDWHSNFLFIRSFGSGSQDTYAIECLATDPMWGEVTGEDITRYDYAFLKTNRLYNASPLKIRPIESNQSKQPDRLTIVGYSDNHEDGMKLLHLDVQTVSDEGMIGSFENPFGTGNSGAPWVNFAGVHSVSSHYRTGEQAMLWGPELSVNTLGLLEYTGNGCE